jgi:hypothetical protein
MMQCWLEYIKSLWLFKREVLEEGKREGKQGDKFRPKGIVSRVYGSDKYLYTV